jgi:hypothetical protein
MASHTDGPWEIETPREGYVRIHGGFDGDVDGDGRPYDISTHICDVMDNEAEQANAALIAAAPALLAALTLLLHEVEQSGNATAKDFGWPKAVAAARAAIALAESRP